MLITLDNECMNRQYYSMRKNNDFSSKIMMKYSTHIQSNRSARQPRESEPSELKDDSNFSFKKPNTYTNQYRKKSSQLFSSNRLSRNSANLSNSTEKPYTKAHVEKLVNQLKSEYTQQARDSRYSNLIKAKSESGFQVTGQKQGDQQKRSKQSILELQQKLSQYSQNCSLISVKSEPKLLEINKSPERSIKLNQKTEKCRQLCEQIKRKLFKQSVSTTTSEAPKKNLSISDFKLEKLIGQGKFSKVYIARHKRTGFILAIKIIKKDTIKRQNFLQQLIRQIKLQSFFNHVNLVKLYSFFQDKLNFYLLLEYCVGGQLYNVFKVKSKLRQEEWQPIMKGVCEGLYELHRNSVIHRDLKPQNIVLSFGIPKIGDFGWSVYNTQDKRQTFCGTPLYISPELLLGNSYDKEVDIWALGVMMYEFLTGRIPFKIQHERNLLQIVNSTITFPKNLSNESVELLRMVLQKDPSSRIGILDILEHPFLNNKLDSSLSAFSLLKFSR